MNPLRRSRDPVPTTALYRLFVAASTVLALYAFALVVVTMVTIPLIEVVESTPGVRKLASWLLLWMHGVPFKIFHVSEQISYPVGRISGWSDVYRFLPPVGLFLVGYWTARRTHVPSVLRGAVEGAKLAFAYAPLLFGVGLLAHYRSQRAPGLLPEVERQTMIGGSDSSIFEIDPVFGVVFAVGFGYPVLFAGLGGATAYELDRYLAENDRGPLYQLDRLFTQLDERGAWSSEGRRRNSQLTQSCIAGTMVASSQILVLFTVRSVVRGIPEAADDVFWQSIAFPIGGYLSVFLLSFGVAGTLWWIFVEQDGRLSVEQGMTFGWLSGSFVALVVWGLTFVDAGAPPVGGSPLVGAALATVTAYLTIGLLMSLVGALAAGLLMAHHRRMTLHP